MIFHPYNFDLLQNKTRPHTPKRRNQTEPCGASKPNGQHAKENHDETKPNHTKSNETTADERQRAAERAGHSTSIAQHRIERGTAAGGEGGRVMDD